MRVVLILFCVVLCVTFDVCPDSHLANLCADQCSTRQSDCKSECSTNDSNCVLECDLRGIDCTKACPCFENCPGGCNGCHTAICQCKDPTTSPDFLRCQETTNNDLTTSIFEDEYAVCSSTCTIGDLVCIIECIEQYNENLETCPCQSQCPDGCPCPEFECLITTTSAAPTTTTPSLPRTSVLILSTHPLSSKLPVITNGNGKEEYPVREFYFLYGENTSVYGSCSISWRGEYYIFGGNGDYARQVSKLNGCKLERIGSLDFNLTQGDCVNFNDETIYLCFDYNEPSTCRMVDSPTGDYQSLTESNYPHRTARIAANNDMMLAVGSCNKIYNVHAELFYPTLNRWTRISDYPHAEFEFCRQATIYHDERFYVFGGYNEGKDMSTIAQLNTLSYLWSVVGSLTEPRRAHGVIFDGVNFLVIGGRNWLDKDNNDHTRKTEKCRLTGDSISCVVQEPTLTYYEYYPELLLVPETYCKDFP